MALPGTAPPLPGRTLLAGALAALAFAVLWVLCNGPVIDETVVSAQILTGDVHYPAGHPHLVFHRQAWSLPNQLSALLWAARPDTALVSALRNVLCLFLTLFTPYLLTLVLTRSVPWAAAAAALVLADGLARFGGVYPDFVLPTFYSHGHVGAYGLVLAIALSLAARFRTAGFLLGLFPAVHPLLGVLAWAWAAIVLVDPTGPRAAARRRFLGAAAVGAGIALVSFLVARSMAPEPVTAGLYRVGEDGARIRAAFLALTDVHRRMPPLGSPTFLFGYAGGALLLATLLLGLGARSGSSDRAVLRGLAFLGLLVWGVIGLSRLAFEVFGRLPDALVTAMPNRLSNVSLLLVVPLAVAVLARAAEGAPRLARLVAALVLVTALQAFREAWLGGWVGATQRSLPGLFLVGAALGAGALGTRGLARAASLLFALGFVLLHLVLAAGASPWPPAAFAGAFVLAALAVRAGRPPVAGDPRGGRAGALLAASLLALAGSLPRPVDSSARADADAVRVTDFDRELVDWLARDADPDELLLPPLVPRTQLQAKTGHPVLLELGTLWLMPYLPDTSSAIGRLTADLYGVDYGDPQALARIAPEGSLGQWSPVWRQAWERRSAAAWRALGERWSFRLVLAPSRWRMDLTPALTGKEWTLYTIDNR